MSKYTRLDDELHGYVVDHGTRQDDVLRRVQAETAAMGRVANMQVAPDQGAFLTLLCRLIGASEALELGTFTGYSAICIARGLAPGRAADRLRALRGVRRDRGGQPRRRRGRRPGRDPARPGRRDAARDARREAFDFAFIDADKAGYPEYYELVLARLRPGGRRGRQRARRRRVVDEADDGNAPDRSRRSCA